MWLLLCAFIETCRHYLKGFRSLGASQPSFHPSIQCFVPQILGTLGGTTRTETALCSTACFWASHCFLFSIKDIFKKLQILNVINLFWWKFWAYLAIVFPLLMITLYSTSCHPEVIAIFPIIPRQIIYAHKEISVTKWSLNDFTKLFLKH